MKRRRSNQLRLRGLRRRRKVRRGRPPGVVPIEPHRERPRFTRRTVQHVRLRLRRDVPSLRRAAMAKVLRKTLVRTCEKAGFRVCQFSIQRDHIHLIVEADHHVALAKGMQGFAISAAKRLNRLLGRRGSVFLERYRCTPVRNATQMRATLVYVLHNARRHGSRLRGLDPYSSGRFFDGWSRRTGLPRASGERPVARATTRLLSKRWRHLGLIDPDETPPAAGRG